LTDHPEFTRNSTRAKGAAPDRVPSPDSKRPGLTVLIVDDNPSVCRLIHGIVTPLVEQVFDCANGEAAIRLYRECQPDVVLMDVAMRGIDGITATRRIREQDPEACIVIVTNHDQPDLREAAAAAGASGYVLKTNLLELRLLLERFR
jgi:CheY-like chemotaxis protein